MSSVKSNRSAICILAVTLAAAGGLAAIAPSGSSSASQRTRVFSVDRAFRPSNVHRLVSASSTSSRQLAAPAIRVHGGRR